MTETPPEQQPLYVPVGLGTCSQCNFWDPNGIELDNLGRCRFSPPRVVDQISYRAMWPICRDVDWCAQWVKKP